jgi:hypothetical protein
MGRHRRIRRIFVEECTSISASEPATYAHLGISLDATSCPNGGVRLWFKCPTCNRRGYKLYRPPGERFFACRGCHNLTYRSVQEHNARLDRLRKVPFATIMHAAKYGWV